MHATVALFVALSGLGCQNKSSDMIGSPLPAPLTAGEYGSAFPSAAGGPIYSTYPSNFYSGSYPAEGPTGVGAVVRDTLYSFFVGRSPGVLSPREIEASVFGGYAGH
jgi:hypothetical protein